MASNVSVAAKILIMLRGFGFMRPGFEISLDPMSGRLIEGKKPALLSSPFGIHVKSPGFAGRLPEFSQIPRSPGRENESPGFLSY